MGKVDMVPYEAEVNKLCGDCVTDIAKELKHCRDTIQNRLKDLSKKIPTVPIPAGMNDKEVKDIPDRISQILKDDSTQIASWAEPELDFKVDVKKRKLSLNSTGFRGDIVELMI